MQTGCQYKDAGELWEVVENTGFSSRAGD